MPRFLINNLNDEESKKAFDKYRKVIDYIYKRLQCKKLDYAMRRKCHGLSDVEKVEEEAMNSHILIVTDLLYDYGSAFYNFVSLSPVINADYFSDEEAYYVLMHYIEKNAALQIDDETIDYSLVREASFKSLNKDEVYELSKTERFIDMLQYAFSKYVNGEDVAADYLNISDKEEEFLKEVMDNIDKFRGNLKPTLEYSKEIMAHISCSSMDDVDAIIDCMRKLNIQDELVERIHNILRKEFYRKQSFCEKMHNKLASPTASSNTSNDKPYKKIDAEEKLKEVKVYLTEKDVRNLKKQIRVYFDISRHEVLAIPDYKTLMELIKNIKLLDEYSREDVALVLTHMYAKMLDEDVYMASTYDEMLDVAGIFIYYKVDKDTITNYIIREYENLNITYEDGVESYVNNVDKINYLDPEMGEILGEYYNMLSEADNDNSKVIRETIGEETKRILSDKTYAYELSEAKRRGEA